MQLPTLAKVMQASKDEIPVARLLESALHLLGEQNSTYSQQQVFDAVVDNVIKPSK